MTEPGWYHGQGDPVGTVRYWDGTTWVGEPTTDVSHNDTVFYAATAHDPVLAGATAHERATGAIAYTTTSRETTAIVAPPPAPAAPQPNIPASAQLVAIGLCALKSLGLLFVLVNTVAILLLGSIALSITYNEDVEKILEWTVGISLATIAIGAALLAAQAVGAAQNRPVLLLVAALIMTVLDGTWTLGAWSNEHSTDQYFYTGLLLLQGWVTVGAIIALVRPLS